MVPSHPLSTERITLHNRPFTVLISERQLQERITELGAELANRFRDRPSPPILLGVLNGCFIFMADLIRAIPIDCETAFIRLSSYGDRMTSSGVVREEQVELNLKGRDVVIVEDIVDTGLSLKHLRARVEGEEPASVCAVALLHKKEATKVDVSLEFTGFVIPDAFVVGYGLDYAELGRNLHHIYVLDEQ